MNDRNTLTLSDDIIATYSSSGPTWPDHYLKPDLVAPGNRLVSLRVSGGYLDTTYLENKLLAKEYTKDPKLASKDGVYYELSGTSMAAPVVSGAAALMLEKDSSLTPATIKARLMKTARKVGKDPYRYGAGYVDILAALGYTAKA